MNKYLKALVVAAVSVTFLVPAVPASAAGCVSKGEFRQVHRGMTVSRVHRTFGTSGRQTFRHGTITIRRYRPCPRHSRIQVSYRRGHMTAKVALWHVG